MHVNARGSFAYEAAGPQMEIGGAGPFYSPQHGEETVKYTLLSGFTNPCASRKF